MQCVVAEEMDGVVNHSAGDGQVVDGDQQRDVDNDEQEDVDEHIHTGDDHEEAQSSDEVTFISSTNFSSKLLYIWLLFGENLIL